MADFAQLPAFAGILIGALSLALGGAPLGVLLIDRRLSLVGDSLSHGILPGAALAYVLAGPNPLALTAGALAAGFVVTGLSTLLARSGRLPDDAAFAAIYLPSLAIGVLIMGREGSPHALEEMLFGAPQNLHASTLILSAVAALITVTALVVSFRAGRQRPMLLMMLTALNLVAGFRAFGALMTVGLMMIPAASSRFWADGFAGRATAAIVLSALSSTAGLLIAGRFGLEPGAVMTLAAGGFFLVSVFAGQRLSPWNRAGSSPNRQP